MKNTVLQEYVNHSGGAIGSDYTWGKIGEEYGVISKHYYFNNKTPYGNTKLDNKLFADGYKLYTAAAKKLNRNISSKSFVLNLMARNWYQVKYSEGIYAIGDLEDCNLRVKGGTGYAVEMAKISGKLLFFYNQTKNNWNIWDYKNHKWAECATPILTKNFAGIGTRDITENAINAIKKIYETTANKVANKG